ncbi:MAG: ThiF family adenylyltransferase [Cyclobacteriaceae bacterium]|nr:ThiF family adenylyltransferase [Cyclobacteriaceae bacterium]
MKIEEIKHVNRTSIAIAEKHDIGLEESIEKMKSAKIALVAGEELKNSIPLQAAFLSTLNAGKRTFLKGVKCYIDDSVPNLLPVAGNNFSEVIANYGGLITEDEPNSREQKLLFGIAPTDENSIEVVCSAWQAGLNFYGDIRKVCPRSNTKVVVGGIAGAALGLFHLFNRQFSIIDNLTGLSTGISLWTMNTSENWNAPENEGPLNINFPKYIWSVGLGHLGQAYLWILGLMNSDTKETKILLQDHDIIERENIGSQVLCQLSDEGKQKTRVCAAFLESLGLKTRIIEKPFLKEDQYQEWAKKYKILLNGVDNIETRKSIDPNHFKLFLDGGTNGRLELLDSFTLRNFAVSNRNPEEIWKTNKNDDKALHRNLFKRIDKENGCGQLINLGISTPFVGLFGGTILISELFRSLNKGIAHSSISIQMRDLDSIRAISNLNYDNGLLNLAS